MTFRIAIIGTAGRRDDAERLTPKLWAAMQDDAGRQVEMAQRLAEVGPQDVALVSGGAPYADHLAVRLWRRGVTGHLQLYLPSPLTDEGFDKRTKAGRTITNLHRAFSDRVGLNSVGELREAVINGASVTVLQGFKARNQAVAEHADCIIAYTFGPAPDVVMAEFGDHSYEDPMVAGLKDGGTAQTWRMARRACWKLHVPLGVLV